MRKRNFIIAAVLFVAVGVLVTRTLLSARPLPVTISFLGYTNDTGGIRFARFAVTNHSRATLLGAYCCSQTKAEAVTPADDYFPHEEYLRGGNVILSPGQFQIVETSMPSNQTPWRLSAGFTPDGMAYRFKEWYQRNSVGWIDRCVPYETRMTRMVWICSDWIAP
jgi:hypothetical protein